MRTKGNEPLIKAPEERLKMVPQPKKVSKLDKKALQTLLRLHKEFLPEAMAALDQAEKLFSAHPGDSEIETLVKEARGVVEEVKTEIKKATLLERRLRMSYNNWAGEFDGWDLVSKKLVAKHDICLKKIGDVKQLKKS